VCEKWGNCAYSLYTIYSTHTTEEGDAIYSTHTTEEGDAIYSTHTTEEGDAIYSTHTTEEGDAIYSTHTTEEGDAIYSTHTTEEGDAAGKAGFHAQQPLSLSVGTSLARLPLNWLSSSWKQVLRWVGMCIHTVYS
jgi:hypothetical protein